jgi:hypothetical protein
MPQPTMPMVMRSEGAARPARFVAQEENRVGAASARPVAARKRRRLRPKFGEEFFMDLITPEAKAKCQ